MKVLNFLNFFNSIQDHTYHFGLYRDDKKETINLACISPKYAFNSIKKENPRNMIVISGTLPPKIKYEEYSGIKF